MGKNDLNAEVVEKNLIHEDLMVMRIKYLEGDIPEFKAGQFGTLGLPEIPEEPPNDKDRTEEPKKVRLIRRAYSVASPATERNHLEYFITKVKDGALTPRLSSLNPGDQLWMAKKVAGLFTLDAISENQNLLFVGTGTGLSPFLSMLKSDPTLGAADSGRKVSLVLCTRFIEDHAYHKELLQMSEERASFEYIPTVTRSDDPSWTGLRGRIPKLWEDGELQKRINFEVNSETSQVMLCGNPEMIKSMITHFESRNFKVHTRKEPGNIHYEKYW